MRFLRWLGEWALLGLLGLLMPAAVLALLKLVQHALTSPQWTINWIITLGVVAPAIWLVRRWRA